MTEREASAPAPARTRLRWAPLAIATALAFGVALAAMLGLWEPGWGVVVSFPLLCGALAAGVIRDPEGPEVHHFLGIAIALSLGFTATNAAITMNEIDRALRHAEEHQLRAVRAESARLRSESLPKWLLMSAGAPIGAVALVVRARRRRASTR